jgi:hypothetical protein
VKPDYGRGKAGMIVAREDFSEEESYSVGISIFNCSTAMGRPKDIKAKAASSHQDGGDYCTEVEHLGKVVYLLYCM